MGDGFTHVRPVSSNHCLRCQFSSGTTVSLTGSFRSATTIWANSPMVMPVRTGIGVGRREGAHVGIHQRPFDHAAGDGVRPVQHHDLDPAAPALLQRVHQRGEVGVVAHADVLDVEDERVDAVELLGRRAARRAVEAPDRQAGGRVAAVGHVGVHEPGRSRAPARRAPGASPAGPRPADPRARRPCESMPVWLVMRPTVRPASGAKSSATRRSSPVSVEPSGRSGAPSAAGLVGRAPARGGRRPSARPGTRSACRPRR